MASHVHKEVVTLQKVRPHDGMFDVSDDEHPPEASAEAQVKGQGLAAKGLDESVVSSLKV